MNQVDKKLFFLEYREVFGKLTQQQVNGLDFLLDCLAWDKYVVDYRHGAYMLATTKHETGGTFQPIHEYGPKSYFIKRYGPNTKVGKVLGNRTDEEAYLYAGKGYTQVTGRFNYEVQERVIRKEYPEIVAEFEKNTGKVFDLTVGDQPNDQDDPNNIMYPIISYCSMSVSMRKGLYTGRKLSDYINDKICDYLHARKIINGMDKASVIAYYADKFDYILQVALMPQEV